MEAGTQERSDGQPGGQTKEMATEIAEQAKQGVAQATEKAEGMASQVQVRIRSEVDTRTTDAGERVGSTAEDLRTVGQELRNQDKETPAKLAEQAADRVERAGSYLRE